VAGGLLGADHAPRLGCMTARLLENAGYAVQTAVSGEEALRRLADAPADLVLSDVAMGDGMNGWELTAAVRRTHPRTRVVLATGWAAEIDPTAAARRGVQRVVAKPFRRETLLAAVAETLATRCEGSRVRLASAG
jgi:CheY-like chemotaxis protein